MPALDGRQTGGFVEICARFAARVIEPNFRHYDEANAFPQRIHDHGYEWGIMNAAIPREYGGGGHSSDDVIDGGEVMAAVCAPSTFTLLFNNGSLRPFLVAGTEAQKRRYVRDLINRRGYGSVCMTESRSGTNLMVLDTKAEKTARGWTISGEKLMVGNGAKSDVFVVLADAVIRGRSQGPTFFVVEKGQGVVVSPNINKLGFRPLTTPTVSFDCVEIADDQLIGAVGGGEPILTDTLNYMRIGSGTVLLGIVEGAISDALQWVTERSVQGGLLVDKSHIRIALGQLCAKQIAVRNFLKSTAAALEDNADCDDSSSALKLLASELAIEATDVVSRMFGWRGIDNDFAIQKRFRDARQTIVFEGTTELQSMFLFARRLRAYRTSQTSVASLQPA